MPIAVKAGASGPTLSGVSAPLMRKMVATAKHAFGNAYAPYSKFKVGAAALGAAGHVYGGCNVEYPTYSDTDHAEASALAAMLLDGERRLAAILVLTGGPVVAPPCGGCLQRLSQFGRPETPVLMLNMDGRWEASSLGVLLPRRFGARNLATKRRR